MRLRPVLACLAALVQVSQAAGQEWEDVVHLKDGTIILGTIVEQIPGESLKVRTPGGEVLVHLMDEIRTISLGAHDNTVHLKNGSVLQGRILEQTPGESLEIRTQDGSVSVHAMEEIGRITREPATGAEGLSRAEGEAPDDPRTASAREVEMGMLFGVTHLPDDSGSLTMFQFPASPARAVGTSSLPSLYASWHASGRWAVGPEVSFGRNSVEVDGSMGDSYDAALASLLLGGRAVFSPGGTSEPGIYLLGQGSLSWVHYWADGEFGGDELDVDGDSETDYSAGVGMGYQWRIGPAVLLRMEAQYRRWFDAEQNSFSLVLGFGARLGG